jgi:pyruvate/2-oxoglutarate dehydrogenase complex dihydrolipoamide acyltransferase (E2) component
MRLLTLRGLAATAIMLASVCVHAQPTAGSGRSLVIGKDSAAARVVKVTYQGKYNYVRIETREPGASENQHPVTVSIDSMRALLAQIQLGGSKPEPLFNEDEISEIAPPLVQALSQATAAQDVSFAVTGLYGGFGPLAVRSVTTARVFQQGGELNMIFGLVRQEFEGQLRAAGYLIPFEPGQRAKALGALKVASPGAAEQRGDWLKFGVIPAAVAAPAARPAAPAAAPAIAPPVAAPAQTAPAAAPPPAPIAAPPAADQLYKQTAERLKALQKLKDDGLITEKEFADKRKAILADF